METDIPLRILFVEDVPADAELAERMLRQDGLVFTSALVDTKEAFLRALEEFRPDLIISDYAMPAFDGMAALQLTLAHDATCPFILLTGSMNEETAVACMKAGAADYVIKEHMQRLSFAVRDALERKQARLVQAEAQDHVLRAKEEWERTFDTVPDLICILDAQHTILRINLAMAEKLGLSPSEAVGKTCYECVHGLQSPPDFCPHAQLLKDKQEHTAEFHESRLGGDFLLTCTPWYDRDGEVVGSVHVAHDITERKRVEEALQQSEERLRLALSASNIGPWDWDLQTNKVYYSPEWKRQLGFEEAEIGDAFFEWESRVHPDDLGPTVAALTAYVEGRAPEYAVEFRLRHKDGFYRWIHTRAEMVNDSDGTPLRLVGCHVDITERKQAEELKQRHDRNQQAVSTMLRLTLEDIPLDALLDRALDVFLSAVCDDLEQKGAVFLVEEEAEILVLKAHRGLDPWQHILCARVPFGECLCGRAAGAKEIQYACHLDDRHTVSWDGMSDHGHYCVPILSGDRLLGVLTTYVAAGHPHSMEEESGLATIASTLAAIIEHKRTQEKLFSTNEDLQQALAELKATQQQNLQQERLRALGQMASGIAHDFNNTLSPVLGFSDLMLAHPDLLDDRETTLNYLNMISTGARDAANVVSRLKEFYRKRKEGEFFLPLDLNAVITQAISLTQPKWKDQALAQGITINIETDLQKLPVVSGNESELREALTNLIFNAVDAMPKGGQIVLRTYGGVGVWESGSQQELSMHPHTQPPTHVVLEFSDTGSGMDEETRQRCLDPFYTTKGVGGTGMGLSMVFGIVTRHEGIISVASEPGKGTTFTIQLPVMEMDRKEPAPAPQVTIQPIRPLRILIVDDEPSVRSVVTGFLNWDGHTVDTATNGREGFEKFQVGRFDLVITDRSMPEMNGDQMALLIKQMSPTMPVLMLTGFGDIMDATGDKPAGVDVLLGKPVKPTQLSEAIAKVTA